MSAAFECCDLARYDRGECCGVYVIAPPPSVDWAVEEPRLLEALERIRDMPWKDARPNEVARAMRKIASTAIARAKPGGETGT